MRFRIRRETYRGPECLRPDHRFYLRNELPCKASGQYMIYTSFNVRSDQSQE